MTHRQPTRAELIARIQASSKDGVVLAEMQRLGFWPAATDAPSIEQALIEREAELSRTLSEIAREMQVHGDPQAALLAMRKERMAQARAKREATAQAREQRRHDRALRWHQARRTDAGYLGAGVSGGLQADADPAATKATLASRGLPALETPLDLAQAMGIALAELKFLSFHREVAHTTHYRRFALPKKTGGVRTISAPMPRLKRAQYWVLDNLLAKVPCHAAAHGFLPGRSIVTNAAPHCGQAVVINLDLKDFFPTITYPRIKGVFKGLGYGESVATVLALVCSENACDELEVDGERLFVGGKGRDRVLPQGAPTSPMLTNILCRKLDRRLQGLASKLGFVYTRYADDLTFSAPPDRAEGVGRLLRQVHHVVRDEGFTPHPDKQHVMRAGARQEVTGIVVNDKPSVSRRERRNLRAALHRAAHQGLAAATWHGVPADRDTLVGYANFVKMVDARQGGPLLARARALAGGESPARPVATTSFRARSAQGQAPERAAGAWWVPAEPAAPELALTAGQLQAARKKRLDDQRAARTAAAQATQAARPANPPRPAPSAPPRPTTQPAEPRQPERLEPAGRRTFIAQLILMLVFAPASPLGLLAGVGWAVYAARTRRYDWTTFAIAVMVVVMLRHVAKW